MAPTEKKAQSSLAKKIIAVVGEIGVLKKDKKNDFHNYQYASDEMIVGAIRDAVIKHGLAIFPSQTECSEIMSKTAKGQDQIITKLKMEFELVDTESGESKVVSFYGYGSDTGDKGIYKASTGCEKYFLMKQFLIATPDDPEFDKTQKAARQAYSEQPRPNVQSSTPKPAAQPAKVTTPAPVTPSTPQDWLKPQTAAAPASAEAKPTTDFPPPSSHATRKVFNTFLTEVKKLTKTTVNGNPMFRLVAENGDNWLTFSETVAKNASDFCKQGINVAVALDIGSGGTNAVGIRPA